MKQDYSYCGFTLTELIVSIAVVAVLAALLIGSLSGIRTKSLIAKDQSVLRQAVVALHLYGNEFSAYPRVNNDFLGTIRSAVVHAENFDHSPANTSGHLGERLYPYVQSLTAFHSPLLPEDVNPGYSYGYNRAVIRYTRITSADAVSIFAENLEPKNKLWVFCSQDMLVIPTRSGQNIPFPIDGERNYAFLDGSIRRVELESDEPGWHPPHR